MNLCYLLVDVDGVASFGSQPYEEIRNLAGPEGPVRVSLTGYVAGWVNDCGHLFPDRYPRNVVGSVLLACLGASQLPYAGPVVVTGWDPSAMWRDEVEVRSLSELQILALTWLSSDIRKVLGLEPGKPSVDAKPGWVQDVTGFAEHVRSAKTPRIRFTNDPGEVAELLRRMGGVT